MRITNQMLTNNMMSSINNNKLNVNKLNEQYATGKKIQRPSDDPIVAVRALKLRTNLVQVNQYLGKNIPDALSWMEVTESALDNVDQLLKDMNTNCVDGSNDDLTADNRKAIIESLVQSKTQLYSEGNANYTGRYVFTGFKTDTKLTFDADDLKNMSYTGIKENFDSSALQTISKSSSGVAGLVAGKTAEDYASAANQVTISSVNRFKLAYGDVDKVTSIKYNPTGTALSVGNVSSTDPNCYDVAAYNAANGTTYDCLAIKDSGEVILSDTAFETLRNAESFSVEYDKTNFKVDDLRPEMYFDCTKNELTDAGAIIAGKSVSYTKEDQKIEYEINFGQTISINTQASDVFTHNIGRDIDELQAMVSEIEDLEKRIADVEKMKGNGGTDYPDDAIAAALEVMNNELKAKNSALRQGFERLNKTTSTQQKKVNIENSDMGSRYARVELTEERLSNQQVDFKDLLSSNEDADMSETYINLSMAQLVYNCSLQAASKAVTNTLLDFL
ncbi:flagellar hook-associated protein FlgL [Anaerosporobacter faecicola]|uniref:flagellar hook-associated protein FlgL n=1 Tax=Anaerosporobacter faecicola TaxID=2718714 RepID=UPI001438DB90|nr:flagellar hook-associated protein FlgL [Anaerosporobacter faecicola]